MHLDRRTADDVLLLQMILTEPRLYSASEHTTSHGEQTVRDSDERAENTAQQLRNNVQYRNSMSMQGEHRTGAR